MRRGFQITSFKSALMGALTIIAIMGVAYWAFEAGLYKPNVIKTGQITVDDSNGRVSARTRLVAIGKRSLWQVEVSPGSWRDCGADCEKELRRALAE